MTKSKNDIKALVRKKTQNTAKKAMESKVDSETRVIKREDFLKINSMFPDKQEKYFKINKDEKRYKSLEESLLNVGIGDDPCVIIVDDEYRLVTGHRRQLIVNDHPECDLFDYVSIKVLHWSIDKALIFFFDSNIKGGREIDEISYAEMLEEEINLYKKMQKETNEKFNINLIIAEQQGVSKRSIERQVSLTKLPEELKEQVRSGELKKNTASVISTMDNEVQKALSERKDVSKLTEKDARTIKKADKVKAVEKVKEAESIEEITKSLLDVKDVIKHEFENLYKNIPEYLGDLDEKHEDETTLELSKNIRSISIYVERLMELLTKTHKNVFGNQGNEIDKVKLDYILNSTLIQKLYGLSSNLEDIENMVSDFVNVANEE